MATQIEKALVWVERHRETDSLTLAAAIYRAAWRFNVDSTDLLAAHREETKKKSVKKKKVTLPIPGDLDSTLN